MPISVRLPEALESRLKKIVALTGRSKTFYIIEAVDEYIHKLEYLNWAKQECIALHSDQSILIFFSERARMDKIFNEIQTKINEVLAQSPAKDIEKNIQAALNQVFSKLNLVTKEEFDIQTKLLTKLREKVHALEMRVAELESRHD